MKIYPILEVAAALIWASVISAIACCVALVFGPLAVLILLMELLVGVVLWIGCLLLRTPFAWACLGAPFSGLLGIAAIFASKPPSRPWPSLSSRQEAWALSWSSPASS